MNMPMSSRRSFMSTAAVAAAASVTGCVVTAPAAAAICRAAPYVPTIDAPPLVAPAGTIEASPVASALEAADHSDATLLELCSKFRRIHRAHAEAWERYCSMPSETAEAKALDAQFDARYQEWAAASDACYEFQPRTTAGALALLDVILARDADNMDDVILEPIRRVRAALAGVVQS